MADIVAVRRRSTPLLPAERLDGAMGSVGLAEVRRLQAIVGDTDPRVALGAGMPLLAPFEQLLPRGLRRGAVVAVEGGAARMSLAMALMVQVSAEGGWCGVVGAPSFGCVAASELGIRTERLALVPQPGPAWMEVTAALLPGLDVVLVQPPGPVSGQSARRLAARARQHRCTVLTLGAVWEGSDVRIATVGQEWFGILAGRGRLRSRRVRVVASTRPGTELDLWLPGQDGVIRQADLRTVPLPVNGRHERAS